MPAACEGTTTQAGGLELILATNLPQADFDTIHVEISQQTAGAQWNLLFKQDYPEPITPLPATIAISAGTQPDQEALIQASAWKGGFPGGRPILLRELQVQVPTGRVAELEVFLSSLCAGQVQVTSGKIASSCADNTMSCQPDTGKCGRTEVDGSTLRPYSPGDVTGLDAGPRVVGVDATTGDGPNDGSAERSAAEASMGVRDASGRVDGPASDGESGTAQCIPGAGCSPSDCRAGQYVCGDAGPVCIAVINQPDGHPCGAGAGLYCRAGTCGTCQIDAACAPDGNP
jgi:hypothetical protein